MFHNREDFREVLKAGAKQADFRLDATELKAILNALSERDETAESCRDSRGEIEADPELRDTENVPLSESISDWFEREVRAYVPDAWIDRSVRDKKDGQIGKVGYEINFNRYFYNYQTPRPLDAIEADISSCRSQMRDLLNEVIS